MTMLLGYVRQNDKSFLCNSTKLSDSFILVREQLKELTKQFDKSENDLKALQSVGQIVGEVLKQLTEDKCKFLNQVTRTSSN